MRTAAWVTLAVVLVLGCSAERAPNRPAAKDEVVREDVVKITEAESEFDRPACSARGL